MVGSFYAFSRSEFTDVTVHNPAGAKLFLPVSLSGPPYFRYREEGGGVTAAGEPYGGELLRRMVTGYLQGSF